ncbi:formamidopyrimidine-DNA glycosylase [Cyphellophora europaea CBS 101466]|uniref:Formamidopyrimidine-DNA glycosylase n=1 Tax=Cyphellophora europaea (strain CBS 101466) TaxID=1220924 RepID=W2SD04_CYPE1|nr:formamidopyrimidine-DNA glycosylase [Cyphellophora europaea CBS 101466]ETN46587.1 formamidopyrimidine-DNA glycosylase [Cyphellophora europaea CBS 101466]
MPEIAEIARTVHYVRKHLVGKTIASCTALNDDKVFDAKYQTTGPQFEKHMINNTIKDVGQQGKYFYLIMSKPPHPVLHFGMSGWLKYKNEHTYYYQPKEGETEPEEWPAKYWKFHLETKPAKGEEKVEAAFVDSRRFARIKLVDCPGDQIRQHKPLSENGPDPVIDKDKVTVEWLKQKCHSKKVPIKAMLLDQANISGIGNWVGDEIMFNARMHPEQYANTLTDEQIEQLHKSIHYVCGTACELLADSEKFPDDWLFKHRWGKGKKDATKTLPSGEKILFLTVGGRTSAVVPSLQKKTGPVAKDMDEAEDPDAEQEDEKPKKTKGKGKLKNQPEMNGTAAPAVNGKKRKVKEEEDQVEEKKPAKPAKAMKKAKADVKAKAEVNDGRRRSSRRSKA